MLHLIFLQFSDAIYDVVEHYTKTTRDNWVSIMDSDSAVIGQVEDMVNEIRWKLSVNAVKLFKVCHFPNLNPFKWIQRALRIL